MLDLLSRFSLTAILGLILIAGVAVAAFERQWTVLAVVAAIISSSFLLFLYTYHRRLLAIGLLGALLFFAATDRDAAVTTLVICVAWMLFEMSVVVGTDWLRWLFRKRKNA